MLPLWQALQSGSIQNRSEQAAILRQIESALSDAQIEAIGVMRLTFTDMNDWAAANGVELPQFGPVRRGRPGWRARRYVGRGAGPPFARRCRTCRPKSAGSDSRRWALNLPENAGAGGPEAGQGGPRAGGRFNVLMTPLTRTPAESSNDLAGAH